MATKISFIIIQILRNIDDRDTKSYCIESQKKMFAILLIP
jgi:hypothetical protein